MSTTRISPGRREVLDRVGPLDAAVLHLGGTRILGVTVTADGELGAALLIDLAPAAARHQGLEHLVRPVERPDRRPDLRRPPRRTDAAAA